MRRSGIIQDRNNGVLVHFPDEESQVKKEKCLLIVLSNLSPVGYILESVWHLGPSRDFTSWETFGDPHMRLSRTLDSRRHLETCWYLLDTV